MEYEYENENETALCTPPELRNTANIAKCAVIPEKSKSRYQFAYQAFLKWQEENNASNVFTENTLLAYFQQMSISKSPNTMWSTYSMLKSMIKLNHRVNIVKFTNLFAFLKAKSKNYAPKKSYVFDDGDIATFIQDAPDEMYLAAKVILIFGIMGACRTDELVNMKINWVENHGKMFLVKIPQTKTGTKRAFTISDEYFEIVEKYKKLRPTNFISDRFFIQYHNGKCSRQVIGKNKFSQTPREIAIYLKLEEPERYTGHSFRRTSTTLLANAGADLATIKRHGGWKSLSVAEGYIEDSVNYKKNTEHLIKSGIGNNQPPKSNKSPISPNLSMQLSTSSAARINSNNSSPVITNINTLSSQNIVFENSSPNILFELPMADSMIQEFDNDQNKKQWSEKDIQKHVTLNNCSNFKIIFK